MAIIEDIRVALDRALEKKEGFFPVAVEMKSGGAILVEVDSDKSSISLDDIILLTREIKEKVGEEALGAYDLTVASSGLTAPLRLPRQYKKYIGQSLAVLQKSGTKETGILTNADDEGITLQVTRKVKEEGKKKKVERSIDLTIPYVDIKSAVYDLKV